MRMEFSIKWGKRGEYGGDGLRLQGVALPVQVAAGAKVGAGDTAITSKSLRFQGLCDRPATPPPQPHRLQ
jgi:hypothetical protein